MQALGTWKWWPGGVVGGPGRCQGAAPAARGQHADGAVTGVPCRGPCAAIVQLSELGPNFGLVLARDFLAPSVAIRAGLEADDTPPTARAMPMGLRVAAFRRVIEVDAVFAPPAPARHGR